MVLSTHISYPHTRTYVLKLHRDAAPGDGQLLGRLEHVESGQQFPFQSGEELLACLAASAALLVESASTSSQEGST
jgi:hypothetical protein